LPTPITPSTPIIHYRLPYAGKVERKRNYKTMDFSVSGADFGVSAS
jgi:hypothetical protein